MTDLIIDLVPTACFLDVQRILDDLEGFGWDVVANVDINGRIYVEGVPREDWFRVADFVMSRSRWVITRISDRLGVALT